MTDHRRRDERPRRELLLLFKAQCADVVPGEVRRAEDLLNLPPAVLERIQRDLADEQIVEWLDGQIVEFQNRELPKR